ncbi:MAG: hypothetical protein RLZZ293_1294 [Pseudomonadota bacterium]|jgi:general secretion pathway protein K
MKQLKNAGAALVTVLVIVFIVMAIIANLTVTNFTMVRRLENRQLIEQATAISYSAIDFGRALLATSGATSKIDTLNDVWAKSLPKTRLMDDVYMSGSLVDEQSKFNINDLVTNGQVNSNVLNQFTSLLSYLNLSPSLATNIAYYMASPANQRDIMLQYTMGKPPYRPAGRPLVDLSELVLVKGVNEETVEKLSKYITAIPINGFGLTAESMESAIQNNQLPTTTAIGFGQPINVNTASAEVIAAKSGIPLGIAQRMISMRNSTPFESSGSIISFLKNNGVNTQQQNNNSQQNLNLSGLGVSSSYFTIHAIVDDQYDQFRWVAYVFRQNRSGQWPQILWQHPE